MSWWGLATPGGDVRVTIPTSDRFAVEALIGRAPREGGVTRGLYGGQVKQTLRQWQSADVEPFLTALDAPLHRRIEEANPRALR